MLTFRTWRSCRGRSTFRGFTHDGGGLSFTYRARERSGQFFRAVQSPDFYGRGKDSGESKIHSRASGTRPDLRCRCFWDVASPNFAGTPCSCLFPTQSRKRFKMAPSLPPNRLSTNACVGACRAARSGWLDASSAVTLLRIRCFARQAPNTRQQSFEIRKAWDVARYPSLSCNRDRLSAFLGY